MSRWEVEAREFLEVHSPVSLSYGVGSVTVSNKLESKGQHRACPMISKCAMACILPHTFKNNNATRSIT